MRIVYSLKVKSRKVFLHLFSQNTLVYAKRNNVYMDVYAKRKSVYAN